MIDRELMTRKSRLILQDIESLEGIATTPADAFLTDSRLQAVAERCLERIIGRMIDINYHLITERGGAPPSDYYQSFVDLGKIGVLPAGFAQNLAPCAGIRNRLVHEYDALNEVLIHEAVRSAMSDVPEYLRHVEAFLGQGEADH